MRELLQIQNLILRRSQIDHAIWWQLYLRREWTTVPADFFGSDLAEVADTGTAKFGSVRVENLVPSATFRQTDTVIIVWYAGEVAQHGDLFISIMRLTQIGEHVVVAVGDINPFKTGICEIFRPQRWVRKINFIQRLHAAHYAVMLRIIGEPPID